MKFVRVPWSPIVAARVARAMKYSEDARAIGVECERGVCECWEIDDGASYMITRREDVDLVVVCFEGCNVVQAAEHCKHAARSVGLPFVRFHTQSRGLIRLLATLGPEPIEYVMRISAYGQQIEKLDNRKPNHDQQSNHRHDNQKF